MKRWLNILSIAGLASLVLVSCKKDETRAVVNLGAKSSLTATPATLVLDSSAANRNNTAITFTWSESDFGYKAGVTYTLQLAKTGTNFANPREATLQGGTTQKYSHADFNQLALLAGLPPGSAGVLDARVRATVSTHVDTVYSDKITVTVTPYLVIINYPSLWVPGEYQGWSPNTAPKVSSRNSNGQYEGFVNIPASAASFQFKLTSDPDWNHTNYGWASSTTTGDFVSGTLSTAGSAGNLFVPSAGYYRIKANTTALTWEVRKMTWAIIGDAPTASNNWSNDVPMSYSATTNLWTVTTNFGAGKFKFRANSDWGYNLGDTGADLILEYDGADIAMPVTGSHTITLDLRVPGNYTYKIQ